jgi:hypothetical protein
MHVTLNRDNMEKLLRWSHEKNRSVNDLVNLILASVESVEAEESMKVTTIVDGAPARKKVHHRKSNWTIRL